MQNSELQIEKRYAQKGAQLPRKQIFRILREQWLALEEGRTSAALAQLLEVTPQSIATFANETSTRCAPWWSILKIADELQYEIVIRAEEVVIKEKSENLKL